MRFLAQTIAIFLVTVKRLVAQPGMALAMLVGIITAVSLTMAIPMYADAAYQKILVNEIEETVSETNTTVSRPPFALMFRYLGAWYEPVEIERLKPIDQYLSTQIAKDIGLPGRVFVRYFKADIFGLYPNQGGAYENTDKLLERVSIASLSGVEEHIQLIEGHWPSGLAGNEPADRTTPVEVLIHESLSGQIGLQAGDIVTARTEIGQEKTPVTLQIKVAGIWRENETQEPYWYYGVGAVAKDLLTPEPILLSKVASVLDDRINEAIWYWIFDGSHIQYSQVPQLSAEIERARATASKLLPKTMLEISPLQLLTEYQESAQSLVLFMAVFSLPLFFMVLVFIHLIAGMMASQRRNEIATLRSRGVTIPQLLSMALFESAILGIIGFVAAAACSQAFVAFFNKANSFLNFSSTSTIQIQINQTGLKLGLVALIIIMIAQVIPTSTASRHSIISYKQELARQQKKPWWQRAGLDVILLLPSIYGIYLMNQQGQLFTAVEKQTDMFHNPLLLLLPALTTFALTLLIIRCLPYAMHIATWITSRTSSVGFLLATRHLSRSAGDYGAPFILLVLTLSLSTFTASMAQTLDRYIHDQTYYQVGADIQMVETGTEVGLNQWELLPFSEHLQIPGVQIAARVRKANLLLMEGSGTKAVDFYGIDRYDFQQVAFWRSDFAEQSLGALMNQLAQTPEGVIVSRDVLLAYGYQIGDILRVKAFESGQPFEMDFRIVGTFDYFPTWIPGGTLLLVGNLDYYFGQIGWGLPYNVWIKTTQDADSQAVIHGVKEIYKNVLHSESAREILEEQHALPERQGIFGILSLGFSSLAFLSALGFLLYSLSSFRRRFIELGMLRAIGLSTRQMLSLLSAELALLFLTGLAAGTGLGVWISNLIIPYLQAENSLTSQVPPFLIKIDWLSIFQIYILFIVLYVAALILLMILLVRMKIFQAIKLGETL